MPIVAGLAGVAVLLLAAYAALFALLFVAHAGQAPDAFAPDGDPCCGTPDTWSEVAQAAAGAVVAVAVTALLLVCGIALLVWARRRRWPRRRAVALAPAGAVGALLVLLTVAWLAGEPRLRAPCDGWTLRDADWRSRSDLVWLRTAEATARCGALQGATAAVVRRRLGRPTTRRRWEGDAYWSYVRDGHTLVLRVRRDRVASAEFLDEPT